MNTPAKITQFYLWYFTRRWAGKSKLLTAISLSLLACGLVTPVASCALTNEIFSQNKAAQQAGKKLVVPEMRKYVSEQANFVVYIPAGWTVNEGAQPGFRTIFVTDPEGRYQASLFYGVNTAGSDVLTLARRFVEDIGRQFPDLRLQNALASADGSRVVFDGSYAHPQKGKREFRSWLSVGAGEFSFSSIETPAGQLAERKQLLLTILTNMSVTKGAFTGASAKLVPLVQRGLSDGSATFRIPPDWQVQDFGKGVFVANDPSGFFSFMVVNAEVLTPQLGVRVPNVPVAPYMPPHRALQFLSAQLVTNMQFIQVNPLPELDRMIAQVYSGPVTSEEFVYTATVRGRQIKGYTFGITFGSRLNVNWRLFHMTVGAPMEQFDAYAPNFVAMFHSYKINEEFARNYVAQGLARVRQMQQQTAQMVTRNAQEIRQMMQSAYDERQRSQDYIDYQRTNYIRGEQDWISTMEGGTVYHTDSWGTKNTETGEFWGGKAYNYVNFTGENPKYREQMTPIDNRALYERYKK